MSNEKNGNNNPQAENNAAPDSGREPRAPKFELQPSRRDFFGMAKGGVAAAIGAAIVASGFHYHGRIEDSADAAPKGPPGTVTIVEFSDAGQQDRPREAHQSSEDLTPNGGRSLRRSSMT